MLDRLIAEKLQIAIETYLLAFELISTNFYRKLRENQIWKVCIKQFFTEYQTIFAAFLSLERNR